VQFANYFSEFSNIMNLPKSIHNNYSEKVCDEDNISDVGENTQTDDSDSNDRIVFNNENINLGSLLDLGIKIMPYVWIKRSFSNSLYSTSYCNNCSARYKCLT